MSLRTEIIKYPHRRLEEGMNYIFTVEKNVEISPESKYFVLRDQAGYRMLLPAEPYKTYPIKTGETIRCRVDKINCSGQIFLEPEHPVFSEGKIYEFTVSGISHSNGLPELQLTGEDGKTHSMEISNQQSFLSQQKIQLRIERIKKGKLFLTPAESDAENNILIPGKQYQFIVTNCADGFYHLESINGHRFKIETQWYRHYNIQKGNTLLCTIPPYGSTMPEPEHPHYKTGETYFFTPDYLMKAEYAGGNYMYTLIARDIFNEEAHLHFPDGFSPESINLQPVKATVNRIRKGRVYAIITMN